LQIEGSQQSLLGNGRTRDDSKIAVAAFPNAANSHSIPFSKPSAFRSALYDEAQSGNSESGLRCFSGIALDIDSAIQAWRDGRWLRPHDFELPGTRIPPTANQLPGSTAAHARVNSEIGCADSKRHCTDPKIACLARDGFSAYQVISIVGCKVDPGDDEFFVGSTQTAQRDPGSNLDFTLEVVERTAWIDPFAHHLENVIPDPSHGTLKFMLNIDRARMNFVFPDHRLDPNDLTHDQFGQIRHGRVDRNHDRVFVQNTSTVHT